MVHHTTLQCKIKFCNYCKSNGHVITNCRGRPQNRTPRAYHVNTSAATTSSDTPSASVMSSPPPASNSAPPITPELVQQMIMNAAIQVATNPFPQYGILILELQIT